MEIWVLKVAAMGIIATMVEALLVAGLIVLVIEQNRKST